MKKKVYISSTYKDLKVYREAIRDLFQFKGLQDEYTLVSMEGYVSENGKKALEVCINDVNEADIYVLIMAQNYGSIVGDSGISYTEMEYNAAKEQSRKDPNYNIFVFYSSGESEEKDFGSLGKLNNPALQNFYKRALNENASFIHPFSTPDNLCKQILLAFIHNYKKLNNYSDYENALILINRIHQTHNFSKSIRNNIGAFYFSSLDDNSPKDFVERIHIMEMAGNFNKCHTALTSLSIETEKFKKELNANLINGWRLDINAFDQGYSFNENEKLFLSIGINVFDFKCDNKIDSLYHFLVGFLPQFLITKGENNCNHIFILYYTYRKSTNSAIEKFEAFISKLTNGLDISLSLAEIDELKEVSRDDTENWLKEFVKFKRIDDVEMDKLLGADELENPWGPFTMKKIKTDIKKYLDEELKKLN